MTQVIRCAGDELTCDACAASDGHETEDIELAMIITKANCTSEGGCRCIAMNEGTIPIKRNK